MIVSFSISFLFPHSPLSRYIGVIEYVFCHAGVLVCLFVVDVADFWYVVIEKTGYRILNCIIISWSFIFGFYLSLWIPQILLKVIFVAVIVSTAHSYLDFIFIGSHLLGVSAFVVIRPHF